MLTLVASMGGFIFGYEADQISGILLMEDFNLRFATCFNRRPGYMRVQYKESGLDCVAAEYWHPRRGACGCTVGLFLFVFVVLLTRLCVS